MKKRACMIGVHGVLLVFGLVFLAGCSNGDHGTPTPDGGEPFQGTWKGPGLTVEVRGGDWTATRDGEAAESGTYRVTTGIATMFQGYNNKVGSATVSGNIMVVTMVSTPPGNDEQFILTKR